MLLLDHEEDVDDDDDDDDAHDISRSRFGNTPSLFVVPETETTIDTTILVEKKNNATHFFTSFYL